MAKRKVSEQKALHAMRVLSEWRKQQDEPEDTSGESLLAQVEFTGVALKILHKEKELHPQRSKSWITNKLLKELHEFREGKR